MVGDVVGVGAKQHTARQLAPGLSGALTSLGQSPCENSGHGGKSTNMEGSIEQRYAIKFCFRLGKTATQTLSLIKEAYKDEALSKAQVFRWHSEFRNGRESVEDLERAGRPTTVTSDETVTKVRNLLNSDRRLSLRLMAAELDMNHTTVHKIVTEQLGMRKICAKLVPRVLSDEQKQRRVECCQEMLNLMNSEPDFEDDVITGDESWVFQYDPETKRQSAEWHTPASPRPKKARMSKSKVKTMLIVFLTIWGGPQGVCTPRTISQRRLLQKSPRETAQERQAEETRDR